MVLRMNIWSWRFETCWILKIEWFEMWEILFEIYSNEGFWNVIKNERFKLK